MHALTRPAPCFHSASKSADEADNRRVTMMAGWRDDP
jgi:hypothetical protein